jgi:hypothetical protein
MICRTRASCVHDLRLCLIVIACGISLLSSLPANAQSPLPPANATPRRATDGNAKPADLPTKVPAQPTPNRKPVAKVDKKLENAKQAPKPDPKARAEFSPEFRESLRRTNELRRLRRASRGQASADDSRAPGAIVPWPMPPSLIVKQTPQVHDEIGSFLRLLRQQGP